MRVCRVICMHTTDEEGEPAERFGIRIEEEGCILLEEADLCEDRKTAERLAEDIRILQPDPIHFDDILEDFVNRE